MGKSAGQGSSENSLGSYVKVQKYKVFSLHSSSTLFLWFLHCEYPSRRLIFERGTEKKRERERNSLTNEVLTSTLSSRHTNLRVGNFPRNRSSLSTSTIGDPSAPPPPTCSPPPFRDPPSLFTRCRPCVPVVLSTVFSGYCTVRLKYLFFCVCFLCIFCVKVL